MKNMQLPFKIFSILLFLFNLPFASFAQQEGPAILSWRSMLTYNQVVDVAYGHPVFYCATTTGMFTYNWKDGSLDAYSKVNGMHDLGMSQIAYDELSGYTILIYNNSNIDLFKDHQFTNIPDLKLSQISGNKSVNGLLAHRGIAYVSTGIGLVLLNLEKKEIKETVRFFKDSLTAQVFSTEIIDNQLFAATSIGVFASAITNNFLTNYLTWNKISDQSFKFLSQHEGMLYAAKTDSVFRYEGNSFHFWQQSSAPITHLDPDEKGIWISSFQDPKGSSFLLDPQGMILDSLPCQASSKVISLADGSVWFGEQANFHFPDHFGLRKRISASESQGFYPIGPVVPSSSDISARNGELWVAHGDATNWIGSHSRAMFSSYKNGQWKNFSWISDNEWVQDFIRILKDANSGNVYAGSFSGGLVIIRPDMSVETFGDGALPNWFGNPGLYNVSGLALDKKGNLWVTNFSGNNELTVMTPDKQFYQMRSVNGNLGTVPHSAADVVIDDYNQKWFIAPANGGVIVYDDNGTIENPNDDQYRILKTGKSNGNLPDNKTTCIVKDKDGVIWIGTANGIGIVYCPGDVLSGKCEGSLKVIQNEEGMNDYLFARQNISALAVDGGNRKWVGTDNGVWLISANGEETIYRFNEENSPLPSNNIKRINIDPVNGDVYFSTAQGIAVFKSTATEAQQQPDPLFIYPNPVPPNFEGMIAVRNLSNEADVRFTDISGQLVYKTKALGGQAVWNGKDYLGRKAPSGVYLVFIVSKDGLEKQEGKLIIQR